MERRTVTLRDDSTATLFFIPGEFHNTVPEDLVDQMHAVFIDVVEEGVTYPHLDAMSRSEFVEFWMSKCCVVMVDGEHSELRPGLRLLGTYMIKPNYIGRCSHVANAGFLVDKSARGKGVGRALGQSYLTWGRTAGYEYSVFNLVFETNTASLRTWDSLGFERIGRVPNAAYLKGYDKPVAAIMFGRAFD